MKSTQLTELLARVAAEPRGSARELAVLELTVAEREMTPIHVHEHDEAFRVLEGEIVVHLPSGSVELRAGDELTARAGEPHAVTAGTGGARYLTTTYTRSVSGYADFQRAVARPGADAVEGTDVVRALGRAAGIEVLGFARTLPASA